MNDPYMQGGDDLSDPIDLSVVQPVEYMADGGYVVPPQQRVVYRPGDLEYLKARQAEADAYELQRQGYNAALEKYRTEVYQPFEAKLNEYNAAAQAYNRDVYEPYRAAYKTYEEAINAFNAGPREAEYAGPAEPTLTPFSLSAPTTPEAFSMQAPKLPFDEKEVAARQAEAARLAKQDAASRGVALEAINAPGQFNLSGMSQGSGVAGMSIPGYMKGGPVMAKVPEVLSAKQMLRKLGNKTKKFADGGAVTKDNPYGVPDVSKVPTTVEAMTKRIGELQQQMQGMPEQIRVGRKLMGGGTRYAVNPQRTALQQELDQLMGTRALFIENEAKLRAERERAAAVPQPAITPTAPTAPTGPMGPPAPGSAKSDLAEIPKPPSGAVVAPERHPDGNVYGSYTSSDGKWFFNNGKWVENQTIRLDPIESPGYRFPGLQQPVVPQPVVQPTQPSEPGRGSQESQDLAKRVLEMAVKKIDPDMTWDTNGDGRISAADALQVAKGWRPKPAAAHEPVQPVQRPPAVYPPGFVGPLPEGAIRAPQPPGTRPGPAPIVTPPSQPPVPGLLPPTSPIVTPPISPVVTPPTFQPIVPVPPAPTSPTTPRYFNPPPPGSMPGTMPSPVNPYVISRGPTAQDLLKANPNLSPTMLGGAGNLGFMQDRLGNAIRIPGIPMPQGFAEGGEVEDDRYEPIMTDPVGTASQMLRELNPQTQMEYEATPKKVSMKRISKTPMESASGSAKGMKMELEEISALKAPKELKRRESLSKAEFEDLAREYGLKRAAALDTAKGLMSETFGKPTLEKPRLTKGSLTKRRFAEGGEAKKSVAKEDKEPGLFGVSDYATRMAEQMFPGQRGQDDQRDAARHMLAAGLVARQYGPRAAELLGKAHEYTSNPHTFFSALGIGEARDDLPYDLHNNRIGIELASRAKSRAELEELVRSMARQSSFEQKAGVPWIMGPEAIRRQKDRAAQRAKLIEEGSQY